MKPTTRESTLIAVAFLGLVGTIVVTALIVYSIDDFLKVWAVLGTLVGVITGAIPSFFFSRAAATAQSVAANESLQHANAEARVQTLLGVGDSAQLNRARDLRPDLFAPAPPGG